MGNQTYREVKPAPHTSGVSCVGKTTIGKQLAQETGLKFFDLDFEIEKYYAKPIEFLQKGFFIMDSFRQKAAAVLEIIIESNQDNYIVALPPSGFMEVYWKKFQMLNPVTIVLTDRAKNIVQRINTSYVYYFNKKYERIGHLFHDRFKSQAVETDVFA